MVNHDMTAGSGELQGVCGLYKPAHLPIGHGTSIKTELGHMRSAAECIPGRGRSCSTTARQRCQARYDAVSDILPVCSMLSSAQSSTLLRAAACCSA